MKPMCQLAAAAILSGALFFPEFATAVSIPEIVAEAKPAIVQIIALDANQNPFKTGTGFFISSDGLLVTNNHVIADATELFAQTSHGAIFLLQYVVFRSADFDLALLKFAANDIAYLELGTSVNAVEGQRVLVIGNPEGLEGTVSDGIISAFRANRSFIQITAPISPGSSGSPVLDESGQVIGIASLVRTEGQNLNFAIPVDKLKTALLAEAQAPHDNRSQPAATLVQPPVTAPPRQEQLLSSFVEEFVASGSTTSSWNEASFYGDNVDYFSNGRVTKAFIVDDIYKYNRRWPQRSYWIVGEPRLEIVDSTHDLGRATVTIGFTVQNRNRTVTGTRQDVVLVQAASTKPKVISVKTQILTRHEKAKVKP